MSAQSPMRIEGKERRGIGGVVATVFLICFCTLIVVLPLVLTQTEGPGGPVVAVILSIT